MKKIIFLLILTLIGTFVVGCGSSHTLKCSMKLGSQESIYEFFYNDNNDEIESVSLKNIIDLGNNVTFTQIEAAKESELLKCNDAKYEICEVSVDNNKIISYLKGNPDYFSVDSTSPLKEAKEDYEKNGYSCK